MSTAALKECTGDARSDRHRLPALGAPAEEKSVSKHAKFAWAFAALVIVGVGGVAYLQDGIPGLNGYVLGALFAGQWAWVLKDAK